MSENQYLVHNTTRDIGTRLQRKSSAEPPRMMLILGGGLLRVMRGRPQLVVESTVRRLLVELLRQEELGRVKLTTPAGLRVDLRTFQVLEAPAAPVPLPHPLPDSADRDKNQNVGDYIPKHQDSKWIPPNANPPVPVVVQPSMPEGIVDESPEEAAAVEEPVVEEVFAAEPEPTTNVDSAERGSKKYDKRRR